MSTEKEELESPETEVEVQEEVASEEIPEETTEQKPDDPPKAKAEPEKKEESEKKDEPKGDVKEKFFERVKKSFPGQEFTSEEEMMEATMSHLNDLEIYVQENDEANEKVVAVLKEQPEIGEIIRDMSKGATFEEALARHVDIEALKPAEGDPDFEKWEQARKDRKSRIKAAKEFQLMLHQNRVSSAKNVEKFRTEKQLSEPEMNEFAGTLQKTLSDIMDGHYTVDFLNMMYKALKYDEAVEENRRQGEIKGKNAKIEELKGKKDDKGDGIPHVASQGQPDPPKGNPVAKGIVDYVRKNQRF
jgi:hypothetical protein